MRGFRLFKVMVFVLAATPAVLLAVDAVRGNLTADPIEEITHRTGWWALTLLMATLAVTPLRRLTGWNQLIRLRRMLGLFAFSYAVLHLLTYVVLDLFFAFDILLEDVAKRPYITVGFTAFMILLALAITSTKGWIRRLGPRWQRLHRLVYVAALLGVVHFYWQVKADTREPLIFAGVLLALFVARLRWRGRRGRPNQVPAGSVTAA
ncbi:MAG: sulfoxide reductase heme-binding subunit YedZ [Gemmatimonadota bacterium]|nr:sulfoxide reductase heme-binding subunit YedZ [Gemmatimonadota bacterium]MDH4350796.1 sulfoxide reductase heme-binding subunit YedZ [Gemmatimonadota bacterium]MDH5198982.1 sulfoxide reductase heme-binding subunit YedZ [Gemmatimonadota bacterium]